MLNTLIAFGIGVVIGWMIATDTATFVAALTSVIFLTAIVLLWAGTVQAFRRMNGKGNG